MTRRIRLPIRVEILISLLIIVTAVVSAITFTMANMFHEDKTTYIRDLISTIALSAADEGRTVLVGYAERLEMHARIMGDQAIPVQARNALLRGLFDDFPDLIAVTLHAGERETASAVDTAALEAAGLSAADLARLREEHPLPMDKIRAGAVHVSNSTLSTRLPMMTMALGSRPTAGGEPVVIVALLRLDPLLRIAGRFKEMEVALTDSDGILLAHRDLDRVARREPVAAGSEPAALDQSAGITREFVLDGIPMLASYSAVRFGDVGATATIPKSAAFLASRSLLSRLLAVAIVLLAAAALVGLFWSRGITRHVEHLSDATREIARGEFGVQVKVRTGDEIGALAESFNQMASELNQREGALKQAQAQIVQSAKLAAFGQLGAGIAHEVKNPLAGIRGCAQLALRKAQEGTAVFRNLKLIEKETKRCEAIIQNLLKFARQEKAIMEPVNIATVIDDAVAIVHHQLELAGVKLEVELASQLAPVRGNANQLQQVLINLMMNAEQAFEGQPGHVRITAQPLDSTRVELRVGDDGPGIPKEIQDRIFDPFFTTKPSGKGTGLGLSVSFGIVQEHGGEIRIESAVGAGTTFVLDLPIVVDDDAEAAPVPAASEAPALA